MTAFNASKRIRAYTKTLIKTSSPNPILITIVATALSFIMRSLSILPALLYLYATNNKLIESLPHIEIRQDLAYLIGSVIPFKLCVTLIIVCFVIFNLIASIISGGYRVFTINTMWQNNDASFLNLFKPISFLWRHLAHNFIKTFVVGIGFLLLIIPGVYLFYRYRYSYYILVENGDMPIVNCLHESAKITHKNKINMFLFDVSLILLKLCCYIPPLYFILKPHIDISKALYYKDIEENIDDYVKLTVIEIQKKKKEMLRNRRKKIIDVTNAIKEESEVASDIKPQKRKMLTISDKKAIAEQIKKEAEAQVRRDAEERLRRKIDEQSDALSKKQAKLNEDIISRAKAEEQARLALEERNKRDAIAKAKMEQEEMDKKAKEEAAIQDAMEKTRQAMADKAQREREEDERAKIAMEQAEKENKLKIAAEKSAKIKNTNTLKDAMIENADKTAEDNLAKELEEQKRINENVAKQQQEKMESEKRARQIAMENEEKEKRNNERLFAQKRAYEDSVTREKELQKERLQNKNADESVDVVRKKKFGLLKRKSSNPDDVPFK